jgi:hypothetical protein
MKTIHIKSNGTKSVTFDEFGKIIEIRAFKKDIKNNRIKNWNKINKDVVRYCGHNIQNFGEFLLKTHPLTSI